MVETYTSLHNHSDISTAVLQFTDSLIKIPDLIKTAYDMGLYGVALSDHECTGGFVTLEQEANKLEKNRDFKHIFANEIYLITEEEDMLKEDNTAHIDYYHFLLVALDMEGVKQIYELSSRAWLRSYYRRGLRRRPTYHTDLEEIIQSNPGHVIGLSACLGGRLPKFILNNDPHGAYNFISWCNDVFGDGNFFLEVQPCYADNDEQLMVNKAMWNIHTKLNIPIVCTTDSHYLTEEQKEIHAIFLNSKDGGDTREADKFYATAHLYTPQALREMFYISGYSDEQIDEMFTNTNLIANRVQNFSLQKTTQIPELPVIPNHKIKHTFEQYYNQYPYIKYFALSNKPNETYYWYQLEKGLLNYITTHDIDVVEYLTQLNLELETVQKLGDIFDGQSMSDYFIVTQKAIDIIWNSDSLVGIGRGSAGCFLSNFLLGIVGIDPMIPELKENFPWWRFCSIARSSSLPDVDIDIQSSKKEDIIKNFKEYWGWRRVCQCVTWGRLTSKTAIERAGRGMNLPMDEINYIKSLVTVKRGKIYSIDDCLNEHNGFKEAINKFDNLLETAKAFEGVIISSGVHAGAVNILRNDFTETGSLMVSSNGSIISQYDLHDGEYAGLLKFDLLSIDALEDIRISLDILRDNNKIEWKESLRDTYNYYLGYDKLDFNNPKLWDSLLHMPSVFQFDTLAGMNALRQMEVKNLDQLATANGLMRLQVSEGEQPIEAYCRHKANPESWIEDMDELNIPKHEQELLHKHLDRYFGVAVSQESVMKILMDENIANFSLKDADKARKAIGKKSAKTLEEVRQLMYERGEQLGRTKQFLDYIWYVQINYGASYSFNMSHSTSYSVEAVQELTIFCNYAPVFWQTALLIAQSGMNDMRETANGSVNYGKICKSIYKSIANGSKVMPPNINKSELNFRAEEEDSAIYCGLGMISGINREIAQEIIADRPYNSFEDFVTHFKNKAETKITKSKIIALIKARCFNDFNNNPVQLMHDYFDMEYQYKDSLTMANVDKAFEMGIVPNVKAQQTILFKKNVIHKSNFVCNDPNFKSKKHYKVPDDWQQFFMEEICVHYDMKEDRDYYFSGEDIIIIDKCLDKAMKPFTDVFKQWLSKAETVNKYNQQMSQNIYNASIDTDNANQWAFKTICYYPNNAHELANVNYRDYNIVSYQSLPEEPTFIEKSNKYRSWRQYDINRICGTVIDRIDDKHMVQILTPELDVITVKFTAGEFAHYKKVLKDDNGNEIYGNWFAKGQLICVCGYRNGADNFRAKRYSQSIFSHTVALIKQVKDDGSLDIQFSKDDTEE